MPLRVWCEKIVVEYEHALKLMCQRLDYCKGHCIRIVHHPKNSIIKKTYATS